MKPPPVQPAHETRPPQPSGKWLERVALGSLVLLAGYYLDLSWRRWPDLQIDFGRELYVPWRLAEGDVLGRDVATPFGPLSPLFNATLFTLFGPGLMVLVIANLAVYAAILLTAYRLLREGWGVLGAWAGCAVFVAVLSFAQYMREANYNYLTPYAHEATHGMLVCLLLAAALLRYLRNPGVGRAAAVGALLGLTALLKIEFLAAGVVAIATAFALQHRLHGRSVSRGEAVGFVVAAPLPTLLFTAFLARQLPWSEALQVAGKGWLTVLLDDRYGSELNQRTFLGTDQPLLHLQQGASGTICGLALFGGVIAGAALVGLMRRSDRLPRWMAAGAAGAIVILAVVAANSVTWVFAGRGLLGLTLLAWILSVRQHRREASPAIATAARIVVGALAIALLFRMLLNVRLYHYGFIQAALATMVVSATVLSEWPGKFLADRLARRTARLGVLAILLVACWRLTLYSATYLEAKTYEVGSGLDFFCEFEPQAPSDEDHGPLAGPQPGGHNGEGPLFEGFLAKRHTKAVWLNETLHYLSRIPADETVLVLPEGVMINYLSRRRTPLAATKFFGHELAAGREARIVQELQTHPPGCVVLLSRDLRDNGIAHYGTKVGEGQLLLQWLAENYTLVSQAGADPLDSAEVGIALFRKKSASTR